MMNDKIQIDVLDKVALTTKSRRTHKVRTRPRHLIHRNCSKRALMGEEEKVLALGQNI